LGRRICFEWPTAACMLLRDPPRYGPQRGRCALRGPLRTFESFQSGLVEARRRRTLCGPETGHCPTPKSDTGPLRASTGASTHAPQAPTGRTRARSVKYGPRQLRAASTTGPRSPSTAPIKAPKGAYAPRRLTTLETASFSSLCGPQHRPLRPRGSSKTSTGHLRAGPHQGRVQLTALERHGPRTTPGVR